MKVVMCLCKYLSTRTPTLSNYHSEREFVDLRNLGLGCTEILGKGGESTLFGVLV